MCFCFPATTAAIMGTLGFFSPTSATTCRSPHCCVYTTRAIKYVIIALTSLSVICDHHVGTRAESLVEQPKLVPMVAADSYAEGSSVNLLCTLAQGGQGAAALTFDWTKDGMRLPAAVDTNYHIERNQDHSLLRIPHVRIADAGEYRCTAKNQIGYDTSSVRLVVNVKLSWLKEPKDVQVPLNRELSVDCQAKGEPKPRIRWERLDNQPYSLSYSNKTTLHTKLTGSSFETPATNFLSVPKSTSSSSTLISDNRFLNFTHASMSDSGIYECIASNGFDKDLRKVIQVSVTVMGAEQDDGKTQLWIICEYAMIACSGSSALFDAPLVASA
ncbi:Down syndrome cell adhesion molecule-like protein Dscam2, partial [Fragariocoptes setiger]